MTEKAINFLQGKPGDLEKAAPEINKIFPDLKEDKIVPVACLQCGKPGELPEWQAKRATVLCKECAAAKAARLKEEQERPIITARLGGLRAYTDFTLPRFINAAAIKSISDYPAKNYYLWGASGTGKTHLATAIVRQYPEAWVVKPQRIYRACQGKKTEEQFNRAIETFVNAPHLVIDDLGVDKKTDFSFSTLYEIIDGRWMEKKTGLIITSNLSLGGLAARVDDDRITSRINDLCEVIEITGDDHRGKK